MRWNGLSKEFEVCDNNTGNWYRINPEVELRSDPELLEVIEWAKKKMIEEKKIEKLAQQYTAVKDAKEKLELVMKLVQDEQTS